MANNESQNRIHNRGRSGSAPGGAKDVESLEEELLVAEALTSPQALDTLCRMYMSRIYSYALKRVGDVEEAEDLTSLVFEKMIERLEYYDSSKASFATWLYKIAMNTITDHYRKKGSRKEQDLESLSKSLHYGSGGDIHRLEMYISLVELISDLPARTREVLTLRFFENMSLAEISETVGMTQKAISKRINRGLKELHGKVETSELGHILEG